MEITKKRGRKKLDSKDKVKSLSICLPLSAIAKLEEASSFANITVSRLIRAIVEYSLDDDKFNNNFKE